jgi:group II intron reverse transcriptase/maturase/CRISPR-associated endonuclease Cas1
MAKQIDILCQETSLYNAWNIVKEKGAMGGIDGVTIQEFEKDKRRQIQKLAEELANKTWKPYPYLEIEVAKDKSPEEKRKLGMTAIRDKIVQLAIKTIIEPRYDRIFVGNSYGYRPGKGATKAIRRVLQECKNKKYKYVLRLDIDNFFDSIDHFLLRRRLVATGTEEEIVRLIMLCMEMGKVKQKSREWIDTMLGTPQGAVLSPLMANLYLHSFDQFAISRNLPYIRYADDFLFLCESREQAQELLEKTEQYLKEKLKLSLNQPPSILKLSEGFDFLGITVKDFQATITEKKREKICQRIVELELCDEGLTPRSQRVWDGISNYYAQLLLENDLECFDAYLLMRLQDIIVKHPELFNSKTALQHALAGISFLSPQYKARKKMYLGELVADFAAQKNKGQQEESNRRNKKLIQQRKKEFRKLAAETSGLLIDKPGTFIGITSRGISISEKGKVIAQHHSDNLSHVVVTGKGVSLSSNFVSYCMDRKIPIDFFDHQGKHIGSIMTPKFIQSTLWAKQSGASPLLKNTLALGIIEGKVKNQHALLKYFNKYHKNHAPGLQSKMEMMEQCINDFKLWKRNIKPDNDEFIPKLMGQEAQVAIRYWDCIRELIADDEVEFDHREHQGATDLMNSMLNYGYAILYARMWQALLAARLNPFESLIHARQEGKPTLVYDMVEIFRSQVVDRMVISLIQKGQELEVRNGLLTDQTRQLLVKSVMERLSRYEKYQGEEMKMENIILLQAKLLAKAFAGTDKFKPYVAKW